VRGHRRWKGESGGTRSVASGNVERRGLGMMVLRGWPSLGDRENLMSRNGRATKGSPGFMAWGCALAVLLARFGVDNQVALGICIDGSMT